LAASLLWLSEDVRGFDECWLPDGKPSSRCAELNYVKQLILTCVRVQDYERRDLSRFGLLYLQYGFRASDVASLSGRLRRDWSLIAVQHGFKVGLFTLTDVR